MTVVRILLTPEGQYAHVGDLCEALDANAKGWRATAMRQEDPTRRAVANAHANQIEWESGNLAKAVARSEVRT